MAKARTQRALTDLAYWFGLLVVALFAVLAVPIAMLFGIARLVAFLALCVPAAVIAGLLDG